MSMKYIRDTYGVPAKRGRFVRVYYQRSDGEWLLAAHGRITSASHHIHIKGVPFHPTWNVVYYDDDCETVLMDTRKG